MAAIRLRCMAFGALGVACSAWATQPSVADVTIRTIRVPNTTVEFTMVRVPGDAGDDQEPVGDLWVLTTEVPWELYDIYVYELDRAEGGDADAIARPSKPYVPPDRGFGHEGYPAISMTRAAAEGFCEWLSRVTGVAFRLPSASEWTHLAGSASATDAEAWTSANSEHKSHPVAKKQANGFGLHDMIGNVAEWVMTDGRRPVAMGGSWRDEPEACAPTSMQQQDRSWNASDPQIPKSKWWLADCSWVGFRFVSEQDPAGEVSDDE